VRRRGLWIGSALALFLTTALVVVWRSHRDAGPVDAVDPRLIATGKAVYDQHCASCHGAHLEGQPNWTERKANGRLPAPPHDESGHTWHHPDDQLFGMVKNGLTPYAGKDYQSDMPAFAGQLSDQEIRAVMAFIESTWPPRIQKLRAERLGRNQKQ